MKSSWTGPSSSAASTNPNEKNASNPQYRALVVDSGPIIKHTGLSNLRGKANEYFMVLAVLEEVRDAKARQHLQQFPFELKVKEPSPESMQRIIEFSKQTGDYPSLSTVDLQVLALVLDLEQEGTVDLHHVRTSPKRKIGLGTIELLGKNSNKKEEEKKGEAATTAAPNADLVEEEDGEDEYSVDDDEFSVDELAQQESQGKEDESSTLEPETVPTKPSAPKSWAALVKPSSAAAATTTADQPSIIADRNMRVAFGSMNVSESAIASGGQYSDADDDDDDEQPTSADAASAELQSIFPSLMVAATVPYEGSSDEEEEEAVHRKPIDHEELEAKKQQALQPVSKSGRSYNSFRKYGNLMKPKSASKPASKTKQEETVAALTMEPRINEKQNDSRISGGGMVSAEDMQAHEDDGEGWITCQSDINAIKATGRLDPSGKNGGNAPQDLAGPPVSQRTACTTTDFAMQNVLLQMGLLLLSVDGMRIRRLKSWVYRCGACFKIHTDAEFKGMKRLFCSHCGSDMMQRIAASVDGKTGRLKVHLSKKYKHNLRGTKYSMPKAGSVRLGEHS
jgi:RNA-binding protein NOB1